jgi:predicted small metal-binding protein
VKTFACGDVVPGCTSTFTGPDDDSVLALVAAHAAADHGLGTVPPELVEQVRASIVTV